MVGTEFRDKQPLKEKWKRLEDKALRDVIMVRRREGLIKRVKKNCRAQNENEHLAHLLDLNARGTHLSDPVYLKLSENYLKKHREWHYNTYINGALIRMGNRTMTQEEYKIIESVEEDKLDDLCLDEKLKDLQKRIDEKRTPNGRVYWTVGPFHCHRTPRNKHDPFNEGYKR